MMKKRDVIEETRIRKWDFFRLTASKNIMFMIIFMSLTYLILSYNFPGESFFKIMLNSLIWLLLIFFCYSVACIADWILKRMWK